jgi:hypothetical protein
VTRAAADWVPGMEAVGREIVARASRRDHSVCLPILGAEPWVLSSASESFCVGAWMHSLRGVGGCLMNDRGVYGFTAILRVGRGAASRVSWTCFAPQGDPF